MKWTEKQLEGITRRGENLIVSAAAGSGKTALLVERIKREILEDGLGAEDILALTFTRSAAGEVRARVKTALYDCLDDLKEEERERILAEIDNLDGAQISTIHAFAAGVIRSCFEEAGVDPSFRIIDGPQEQMLLGRACDEVFEELLAGGEEGENGAFMDLCALYGGHTGLEALKNQIFSLLRFLQSVPDIGEWERKAFPENPDGESRPAWDYLVSQAKDSLRLALRSWEDCLDIASGITFRKGAKGMQVLLDEYAGLQAALDADSIEGLAAAFDAVPFGTFRAPKGFEDEGAAIKALRDGAKKQVRDALAPLKGFDMRSELELERAVAERCRALYDTAMAVQARFERLKGKDLTYSGLERHLLKALENESVRNELKARFKSILVDECQDINGVQERVLELLESGSNRFMVGDVKQSIFGFRNADPEIFTGLYKQYKKDGSAVDLSQNFRSSLPVVNAVNAVFDGLMTEGLGGIDYDEDQRLMTESKAEGNVPEIHIIHTDTPHREEVQARHAAREIRRLVEEEGYSYGDICLLYRSANKKAALVRRVFASEDIPLTFEGDSGFFDTVEIGLMQALLAVSLNPDQDFALTAVLRLPRFGITVDDLATVAAAYAAEMPLSRKTRAYAEEKDGALAEKLKEACKTFADWRLDGQTMPLGDFMEHLASDSGLYLFCGGMSAGAQRQGNIRTLVKMARDYRSGLGSGPAEFARHLEGLKESGASLDISDEADPDSVRLMSIHKAKGLEFPVVFLCETGARFNLAKKEDFIFDRELGISGRFIGLEGAAQRRKDTLTQQGIALKHRKAEIAEEMRLLYVALTRAADTFYILDGETRDARQTAAAWGDNSPEALAGMKCLADWVMSSAGASPALKTVHIDGQQYLDTAPVRAESHGESPLAQAVAEKLSAEVPYEPVLPVRTTTVSRLKDTRERRPSGAAAAGLEYGKNVHTLLEHIDLAAFDGDTLALSGLAARLARDGVITDAGMDVFGVESFLYSPQGKRLRAATKSGAPMLRETEFTADLTAEEAGTEEPVRVTGVIDCLFMEDGKWVLMDFKTDSKKSIAAHPERLASYKEQLRLYALAAEKLTGVPVGEKRLIFLGKDAPENIAC